MKRRVAWCVIGLALVLGACETIPIASSSSTGAIPSTSLNLGDWRRANANLVAQHFEREVGGRYGAGLALTAVSSDLRRNEFTCAPNRDDAGRGDPPEQICRKTITVEGCTHTWQVHLYDVDGNEALARARALYDRRCGGEGLLGGPG